MQRCGDCFRSCFRRLESKGIGILVERRVAKEFPEYEVFDPCRNGERINHMNECWSLVSWTPELQEPTLAALVSTVLQSAPAAPNALQRQILQHVLCK